MIIDNHFIVSQLDYLVRKFKTDFGGHIGVSEDLVTFSNSIQTVTQLTLISKNSFPEDFKKSVLCVIPHGVMIKFLELQ